MSESYTWGLSGTSFLVGYAFLCAAAAVAIWLRRKSLLEAGATDTGQALDVYELAILNGGPKLAVTVTHLPRAQHHPTPPPSH